MERRVAPEARSGLEVRPGRDQDLGQLDLPVERGPVERGHPISLRRVHIFAGFDEPPDPRHVARHGRVGDRSFRCRSKDERGHVDSLERAPGSGRRPARAVFRCAQGERQRDRERQRAHQSVAAVKESDPVLSPKLSTSSIPRRCMSVSMAFAIGVPGAARRWRLPSICPCAPPNTKSGHRLWLCTFGSPMGDP